ncbi:claudin-11-like [Ptychodera flava]|uniref:claudin-11-like n=1 Tax=Ptychodera flava TaxID=63121 RepID=UPI003969E332
MLSPVLAVTGFAASCTAVLLYVICTASDAWLVTTYPQRTNTGLWRHCVDETGCVALGVHNIAAYVHIARALMISACIVGGFAVMLYAVFVRKSFNEKSIIASCTVIAFSGE